MPSVFRFLDRWQSSLTDLFRSKDPVVQDAALARLEARDRDLESFLEQNVTTLSSLSGTVTGALSAGSVVTNTITGTGTITASPGGGGTFRIGAQDGTNEGGQLDLLGAGAYGGASIDNYQGALRLFSATGSNVVLYPGTGGKVQFGGSAGNDIDALGLMRLSGSNAGYYAGDRTYGYLAQGTTFYHDTGYTRIYHSVAGQVAAWDNTGALFLANNLTANTITSYSTSNLVLQAGGSNIIASPSGSFTAIASTSGYQQLYWGTTFGNWARFTSRRELKERIETLTDSGTIIDALRPVTFIPRATTDETDEQRTLREADVQHGFIAEEVAEAAPLLASYEPDDEHFIRPVAWKSHDMIALLVAEVQSLRQRVNDLEQLAQTETGEPT